MFEAAETGSRISKDEYERAEPQLRVELINAQYDLQSRDFAMVVVISGDDQPGCNEVIDLLHEWMDARYLVTRVFDEPEPEGRGRPLAQRYWRELPPRGRIGVLLGGGVTQAISSRLLGRIDDAQLEHRLEHVRRLQDTLAADGTLILRFWLHLPRKELKKRLKKANRKDQLEWRVDDVDWAIYENYEEIMPIVERVLRKTNSEKAPWHIVESTDAEYRNLRVARGIRDALVARLESPPAAPASPAAPPPSPGGDVLGDIDLTRTLEKEEYKERIGAAQARLSRLTRKAMQKSISSVLVLEGRDAAGKGGVIRRITGALPARRYRVIPIAAPTDEERARHYLWRFWRQLPSPGRITIFDRSWYGRVLVERVEGFARPDEWTRAYDEINDFEEQLVEAGMLVQKFWLHIDPAEQMRRFQAREKTPYKKYKITDEDFRNRGQWDAYVAAVNEMVTHTSTEIAPWTIVPSNDKRVARVQVLETYCKGLKRLV